MVRKSKTSMGDWWEAETSPRIAVGQRRWKAQRPQCYVRRTSGYHGSVAPLHLSVSVFSRDSTTRLFSTRLTAITDARTYEYVDRDFVYSVFQLFISA